MKDMETEAEVKETEAVEREAADGRRTAALQDERDKRHEAEGKLAGVSAAPHSQSCS
jgi:hypothetical protein